MVVEKLVVSTVMERDILGLTIITKNALPVMVVDVRIVVIVRVMEPFVVLNVMRLED